MYCFRCRRCAFWFRLYCHLFVRSSGSSTNCPLVSCLLSQNGNGTGRSTANCRAYSILQLVTKYVICTGFVRAGKSRNTREQERKTTEPSDFWGLDLQARTAKKKKNKGIAKPTFIINLHNRGAVFFLLLAASKRSIREFFLVVLASTTCSSRHSSQELPN